MARIGVYTIRIMGSDIKENEDPQDFDERNQKVINEIGTALTDAENTVNEWLPEGYYCKIEN